MRLVDWIACWKLLLGTICGCCVCLGAYATFFYHCELKVRSNWVTWTICSMLTAIATIFLTVDSVFGLLRCAILWITHTPKLQFSPKQKLRDSFTGFNIKKLFDFRSFLFQSAFFGVWFEITPQFLLKQIRI